MSLAAENFEICGWDLPEAEMPDDFPDQQISLVTYLDLWQLHAINAKMTDRLSVTVTAERNPTYCAVNVVAIVFLIWLAM